MSRTPQRTAGQDFIVTSGNVISGDDATADGSGGILALEGGAASGTDAAGGAVLIRPGLPTGSGARGIVRLTNNGGADSVAILEFASQGTNGSAVRVFVGTRDPSGVVSGNPGDLYVRHSGSSSTLKINAGVSDSNTTWTDLVDRIFDSRSSPVTTGSAASGGGTVDFSIATTLATPLVQYLDVTAIGITLVSDVRFYRDAARTSLVYEALARDAFTTPFVDATPWAGFNRAGDLENGALYGRITNNGANASTYDVRIRAKE